MLKVRVYLRQEIPAALQIIPGTPQIANMTIFRARAL